MKIDITKQYRYRNGQSARILCTDAPGVGSTPVLSIDPAGVVYRHKADGGFRMAGESSLDLIEVPAETNWQKIAHTWQKIADDLYDEVDHDCAATQAYHRAKGGKP